MINNNAFSGQIIKISILAFAISIIGVPFSGGNLSLMYYYPVILLVIFIGIISLLNDTMKFKIQHVAILILFLITVFHIANSIDSLESSKVIGSLSLFFIMFFLLTAHQANLKELKLLSNCFVFSGFLISLLLFVLKTEYEMGRFSYSVFGRLMEPNYLASYLSITFLFTIKKVFIIKKTYIKILFLLMSLGILFAMLLTGSRGAFLATIFSSFVLLFYDKDKSSLLVKIFLIFVLFFILFIFLPDNLADRFISRSYNDGSNRIRLYLWNNAISYILERPFLGYGLASGRAITSVGSAHNTFLSVTLNFGMVGLICFLIILFKDIKILIRRDMILFLSILTSMIFTSMIITNYNTIPLWFTIIYITLVCDYKRKNMDVDLWTQI